jgi:hypothetical protein
MIFVFIFIVSLSFLDFVNGSKYSNADCNCSEFTNCTLTEDCSISLSSSVTLNDDVLINSNTKTFEYALNGNKNITINSGGTLTFNNLKV